MFIIKNLKWVILLALVLVFVVIAWFVYNNLEPVEQEFTGKFVSLHHGYLYKT